MSNKPQEKSRAVFRNRNYRLLVLANIINRFDGEFDLGRGNRLVDAKSIIGICSCDLSRPVELLIHSDDRQILDALQGYIV